MWVKEILIVFEVENNPHSSLLLFLDIESTYN